VQPTCTAEPCDVLTVDTGVNASECVGKTTTETCTATCLEGYSGPSAVLTCQPDHSYTAQPECTPDPCYPIALIAEVGVNVSDCVDKRTAETCEVTCAAGYTGPPADFTCRPNHEFDAEQPICVADPCNALTANLGVNVSDCADTTTDDTCVVQCALGYHGTTMYFTCLPDHTYDAQQPLCLPDPCDFPLFCRTSA